MIVVLDTNALHGDVYASGTNAETLFTAAAAGGFEIWVPTVVLEELVRQFPERFKRVAKAYRKHAYDARSLGLPSPDLPDEKVAISAYRERLVGRLNQVGIRVVGPPEGTGTIAEWVAQRREPIPGDGKGTVDAQIWLTALEAARHGDVVLLAKNPKDFADREDETELHPALRQDLEERGLEEGAIRIVETIFEFNQLHVESSDRALGEARALLADKRRRGELVAAIEDAIEWFPLETESEEWRAALGVDYDSGGLIGFDVETLVLLRADSGASGSSFSCIAYGTATVDLDLWTAEAVHLDKGGPVGAGSLDLEAPMVSASGSLPARLALSILFADGAPHVSVEEVKPVTSEEVEALLQTWSDENPGALLELIGPEFDAGGDQLATDVGLRSVEQFEFYSDGLFVLTEFSVDYDNPIDDEDHEFSANNVTEFRLRLKVSGPDIDGGRLASVDVVPDPH